MDSQRYTVAIEEILVQEFEIVASSAEEAMEIAMQKYKAGEFILESGESQFRQIAIQKPDGETSEWTEF